MLAIEQWQHFLPSYFLLHWPPCHDRSKCINARDHGRSVRICGGANTSRPPPVPVSRSGGPKRRWEGNSDRAPRSRRVRHRRTWLASPRRRPAVGSQRVAQERRALEFAMTRARQRLTRTLPKVLAAHIDPFIASDRSIARTLTQRIRTAAVPRQNSGPCAARRRVERGA